MESQEITVRSHLDSRVFSDFSNFNAFRLHNRWLSLIFFPVLMIALALVHRATNNETFFWIFLILGILLPVGYLLFYSVSLRQQIRANGLDTPRHAYTVTVSYAGVQVENATEKASYRWDQIYRVYALGNATYIYITRARAFLLPNADLPEGCTQTDLLALVRRRLDNIRLFDKRGRSQRKDG